MYGIHVIAQKSTNWTNNLGKQSNYVKTKKHDKDHLKKKLLGHYASD